MVGIERRTNWGRPTEHRDTVGLGVVCLFVCESWRNIENVKETESQNYPRIGEGARPEGPSDRAKPTPSLLRMTMRSIVRFWYFGMVTCG